MAISLANIDWMVSKQFNIIYNIYAKYYLEGQFTPTVKYNATA